MRKFLLFACAAVLSLSASAQTLKSSLSKTVKIDNVKFDAVAPVKTVQNTAANKVAKAAPARLAHDGIYGLYVYESTDATGVNPGVDSVWVVKCNETMEGYDKTLNTKIILCSESAPITFFGTYDEETNKITCPALQYCGQFQRAASAGQDAIDYKFYLASWVGEDLSDLNQVKYSEDPIVLSVSDGVITPECLGLCVAIETAEGEDAKLWTNKFNIAMYPANATCSYKRQTGTDKITGDAIMEDFINAAYVEDYTQSVTVYGFAWFLPSSGFGMSTVADLAVNQDLSVTFNAPQNAWPTSAFGISDENAGDWFRILGVKDIPDQPGYVTYDESDNAKLTGDLAANQIKMYTFPVATKLWNDPATGQLDGYIMWLQNYIITLDEGNFSADANSGISSVDNAAVKSGKTYNLFGQEVPASTKGLVIRDGKKFFNK